MTKPLRIVLLSEFAVLAVLLTVALDVRLHHKFEVLGALNMWGYRGEVMPVKKPQELRIAVVGGTFAFGWGTEAEHTLAGYLRQFVSVGLNQPGRPPVRVTATNLAGIDIPITDYPTRIKRFAYLKPDIVCIEPDPPGENTVLRHGTPERSGVFAVTGYMPILPLVLEEKGREIGGKLGTTVAGAGASLDGIDFAMKLAGGEPWTIRPDYADAVADAVTAALQVAKFVVVVLPSRRAAQDPAEMADATTAIAERFAGERRVRVVDLGADAALNGDGMWLGRTALGAGGHSASASLVAPTVLDLVRQ